MRIRPGFPQVVRAGSAAGTTTYAYDVRDRLTEVCFQASCPGGGDPFIRWTYDGVGNRLSEARPAGTTSYTYNAADELPSAGSISYTYDQNGNQTAAGTSTFSYDLANRLKTHAAGNTTTTYSYGGDGVRRQASTGSQASKKTNFVWDVNQSLPQMALERDGNNALLRRYLYGHRRISMTSGGSTSYYHYDPLGSVANLTSATGATQWTWAYEPFGTVRTETKASGSQPTNLMKFTAEYLDPTGLYHLRARQYDATSGRFLQLDPAATSALSGVSSYVYADARPTLMVDPSGATSRPSAAFGAATTTASSASGKRPPKKRPRVSWRDITEAAVRWLVDQLNNPEYGGEMEVDTGEAIGLTHWLAGVPASTAEQYVSAFTKPIYLVALHEGWHFRRYYSSNPKGRWLTRERFRSPETAITGLNLPPENEATCRQVVHGQLRPHRGSPRRRSGWPSAGHPAMDGVQIQREVTLRRLRPFVAMEWLGALCPTFPKRPAPLRPCCGDRLRRGKSRTG